MRAILLISFLLYTSVIHAQIVTTTADAGAGSLRQAIIDANASQTPSQIVFNIPKTDAGFDAQRGVFVIALTTELPAITRSQLVIDGRSQSTFAGNTNAALLGSGGTVGTDALPLPQIDGPEIELVGDASMMHGILVAAEAVQIRGLAIYGFGKSRGSRSGNVVISKSGNDAIVEDNCLGTTADQLTPQESKGCNIAALKADRVTVKNNLIAGADIAGIYITDGANDWLIEGNEIINNDQLDKRLDGIDLALSQGSTVRGNRIANNGGNGVDTYRAIGQHTIVNNTIVGNGQQGTETSGIRLYGVDNEVHHNVIADNAGNGILVTSAAARNRLTQNAIYGNGSTSAAADAPIGIDLIRAEDNHESGSAPFVTRNDTRDWDEGGNGLFNHPIIDQAMIRGDSVRLGGWVAAGATIEFFVGDRDDTDRPQGKAYLFSLTEGSVQDRDATQGAYDLPGTWGSDSTHRFAITLPLTSEWHEGMTLVATATRNSTTSEFGPSATLTSQHLVPIAGCRQPRSDGTYEVLVGYRNHTTDTLTLSEGNENYFAAQAGTPPTVFYPGTHLNVANMRIDSTGGQWVLENQSLSLTIEQPVCPIDLELTMTASEDLVQPGDTVWVITQLENLSANTAFGVDVATTIPAHAVLLQAQTTQGTYDVTTGLWSVGDLTTDQSSELLFQLIINENTLVEGLIDTTDQPDNNAINDRATAHIAVDPSTSGEDGGTESNGNLASKIAVRNFQRQQPMNARHAAPEIFSHRKVRAGTIAKATVAGTTARVATSHDDLLLIPEQSRGSHQAVVVTPADLIGITNADELFSVDYLNDRSQILGSILYIRTTGQVYEHTKAICDRLNGGVLTDIRHVTVQGKPFILSRIDQPNGEIDYALNFVAYETAEGYTVDNRWRNEAYRPSEDASVLNFQVWSVSPAHTVALATQMVQAMQQRSLTFLNNYPPTIPTVYVKSGHYGQGQLHLKLQNTAQAAQADVWGTLANTEDGERASFITSVPLAAGEQALSLPVDQVFDVGFTLANSATGGLDALYLADGPWGVDYERDGAQVHDFVTEISTSSVAAEGKYALERTAQMTGRVRTYASLFRSLRPGLLPQDLQAYEYLSFQASGFGRYEVIVTKESIQASGEQFRHTFELTDEQQTFTIPFGTLTNRIGQQAGAFTAEDVTSVVFNALGNGKSEQAFDLRVENLAFQTYAGEQSGVALNEYVQVFPNPARNQFTVSVSHQVPGEAIAVSLLDLSGRVVEVASTGMIDQQGRWQSEVPTSVAPGVYLLKVATPRAQSISRFIKQ